jgi:hypothetical protein
VIATIAAAGFGGGIVAARISHPATRQASTSAAPTQVTESDDSTESSGDFQYGYSSVGPAYSAPQVQSGGS